MKAKHHGNSIKRLERLEEKQPDGIEHIDPELAARVANAVAYRTPGRLEKGKKRVARKSEMGRKEQGDL